MLSGRCVHRGRVLRSGVEDRHRRQRRRQVLRGLRSIQTTVLSELGMQNGRLRARHVQRRGLLHDGWLSRTERGLPVQFVLHELGRNVRVRQRGYVHERQLRRLRWDRRAVLHGTAWSHVGAGERWLHGVRITMREWNVQVTPMRGPLLLALSVFARMQQRNERVRQARRASLRIARLHGAVHEKPGGDLRCVRERAVLRAERMRARSRVQIVHEQLRLPPLTRATFRSTPAPATNTSTRLGRAPSARAGS